MRLHANKDVVEELRKLADKHDGVLQPEVVVRAAARETSPLHKCFEWDDSKAAEAFRLEQARCIIRASVEILSNGKDEIPTRVFVSLTPDRGQEGYRITSQVCSDAELYAQMLADAKEEMNCFRRKYARISELSGVFAAMEAVK